ncbi:hypothetical protein F5Y12DRAFT_743121 [Xylaria sp. FL1777]|nr:hypothetical protein F5Y12DRAFT_743121 [Xylaria sp. FL1777]
MSQTGGIYRPSQESAGGIQPGSSSRSPANEMLDEQERPDRSNVGNSRPARVNVSTRGERGKNEKHVDEGNDDSQEWELVSIPEEGIVNADGTLNRFENHFDFTVGWGERKLTLFSCDVKYETHKSNDKGTSH